MSLRVLALAAPAAVLASAAVAGGALAQTREELVGAYSLQVTSKSGADCGSEDHLDLRILTVGDETITFGDDSESHTASYNPQQKSFVFVQPPDQAQRDGPVRAAGRFTREPDAVRMYLTVETGTCVGQLTGTRPAPHQQPAPAGPLGMNASDPGPVPDHLKRGPLGIGGDQKGLLLWVPLGALLVLVGGVVGFLVGRPKKKPDAES